MDLHIIPECYIDTKLIKALVPPTTKYNHQKGCSTVVKVMQERLKNDFALGIIDRDKRELGYAEEFEIIFEIQENLQLFKHRNRNHYLIFICPAMEKWLIKSADDSEIKLTDFNLPHDFRGLMNITKTSKSENNDPYSAHFQSFFKELKNRNPISVQLLCFWIEYLKLNPYSADIQFIISQSNLLCSDTI